METIPSILDMHKACLESSDRQRRNSGDDDDEQMQQIFEEGDGIHEAHRLTDLTAEQPAADGAVGDVRGAGEDDGDGGLRSAAVWTSGFEEDGRRPSEPLRLEGDPKYKPHPDDDSALHVSTSFPHMHHPLKMPPHHHHRRHHHHKRRRTSSTSSASHTYDDEEEGDGDADQQQQDVTSQSAGTASPETSSSPLHTATPEASSLSEVLSPFLLVLQMPHADSCVINISDPDTSLSPRGTDEGAPNSTSKPLVGVLKTPTHGRGMTSDDESVRKSHHLREPSEDGGGAPRLRLNIGKAIAASGGNAGNTPPPTASSFRPLRSASEDSEPISIQFELGGDDSDDDEHQHIEESSPLMAGYQAAMLKPCLRIDSEGVLSSEDDSKKKPKVKFNIGSEVDTETEQPPQKEPIRYKRRRRRGDSPPSWRRHPGSQHQLSQYHSYTQPTTPDEASNLREHDLDDISSHRFEDAAAYRRSRVIRDRANSVTKTIVNFGGFRTERIYSRSSGTMKRSFDHHPHDMFVELSELKQTPFGPEWRETARWVKYEEDVNGVEANRWGKPHVAFLNFHSLFSLRKGLDRGAVLLDLEEKDLQGIATRVVEHMVACDQIPADQKEAVINTLLLRHRHVAEDHFKIARRESKTALDADGNLTTVTTNLDSSSTGNLSNNLRASFKKANITKVFSSHSIRRHSSFDQSQLNRIQSNGSIRDRLFSVAGSKPEELNTYNPETGEGVVIQESYQNTDLMKKLPDGAEATTVLVGAVDFLKQPTIAFVRLAEGVMLDNLVEVPIPVRFLFVLLGPYHTDMDYHEVGRSISTLMSDKHFHEVAYRAHSRSQLLSAINEFLNASIVLPPAEWSNSDLIPVDQIRDKAKEMMKRKETIRQKRLESEPVPTSPTEPDEPRATLRHPRKPPAREPLKRVGKPFYGVIEDIKLRAPYYLSDIKDGLSPQVLSAAIFIFFASLSPAITFGGMYGARTEQLIGVGETLLVTCINGVIIALFACQPLLIVGATGPLMIFDLALYSFAHAYGLEFLPMRVWISVWLTVFVFVLSAFEGMTIVKHLTRFTEEIFSTLVCLIFIYGAFEKLIGIFMENPLLAEYCYEDANNTEIVNATIINGTLINGTNSEGDAVSVAKHPQPNTALLSLILMWGTFIIAFKLKKFRNSKYLGRPVRRALGDFGVPISIVVMVLLDYLIEDTYTTKLIMPAGIQPSNPDMRGWFINPFGIFQALPVWVIFACAPTSLLLFILIFIEGNICQLILSKPERNMKKGSGFHWDMFLTCAINIVSGLMGAPFMNPACVRTISHVSALTVVDTKVAPGEPPRIVGALEQRLSALFVSALVGLSIFLSSLLNLVPNSVLYGVFLYMGISATAGIQFLERVILFLVPVKHHPNMPYVKEVRTLKMHMFTLVQITMIVVLWVVQASPAALCFPFVLMILVPLRLYLMPYLWSPKELFALDGGSPPPEDNDEPDFYEQTHNLGNVIHDEDHTDNS